MALDSFTPDQKRIYVITATTIGLILSTASTGARFFAKYHRRNRIQSEDWFITAGLLLSYGIAAAEFYGLSTGLGQHEEDISKAEKRSFMFSIWLLQRFQPPTIFSIKTSIIIFYAKLFVTKLFRRLAWGIWIYTLLWAIEAFMASLFECTPISYFWDKTQQGSCLPNPLVTIGLTNGVLSAVGDIFILVMPLPVLLTLQIDRRKKWALAGIFTIGTFVVATSFLRWIALLGTSSDVTFFQAEAGIWTYMEAAMGITCANLPLLAPLALCCTQNRATIKSTERTSKSRSANNGSYFKNSQSQGFQRMGNDRSESEVELHAYDGHGITVDKKIELTSTSDRQKRDSLQEHYVQGDMISIAKVN